LCLFNFSNRFFAKLFSSLICNLKTLPPSHKYTIKLVVCSHCDSFFVVSLLSKGFRDFCHWALGTVPKSIFPHRKTIFFPFFLALKWPYSLDVPFGGLNFTNHQSLALRPFKVQFLAIRITCRIIPVKYCS
jgi:hypothetical protein